MMFIPRRLIVAVLVLLASIGQADAQSFSYLLIFLAKVYIFSCTIVEPFFEAYLGIGLPGCGKPPVTQLPTPSPTVPSPPTVDSPEDAQIRVACTFLNIPNLIQCKRTTSFEGIARGNTIPTGIGLLTQFTYLDLNENQLTGTIPSTLGDLTQLTYLSLDSNQLTGTIPSTLDALTQLNYLLLFDNQLTGTIPAALGALTQLNVLGLFDNQLTGTIPSTLGALTQLIFLDLDFNQLTGTIPSTLGALTQLFGLYLYKNTQLTGTIPSTLCSISGIRIIIDCDNVVCTCCLDGSQGGFDSTTSCPGS